MKPGKAIVRLLEGQPVEMTLCGEKVLLEKETEHAI